jgi:hypothetical protein
MRPLLTLFLLGLFAPAAHADDAMRARVVDLLSAYEDPATAADWRSLGDAAAPELFAIAQDPTQSHTRRAGAVLALGWFPNDTHHAWLVALAADNAGDGMYRRKACYALVNGWGDAALPDLAAPLAASDVQLRAAAAKAVGRLGTPAARTVLQARLAVETEPLVHDALQKSLAAHPEVK